MQLLALIVALLLSSCAKPGAKITYVELPRQYVGDIRTLAVLPFEGRGVDGHMLASEIEAELLQMRVGGEPYFRVVSRANIDKVLSEITLSLEGITDEKLKLGKLLNADGLLLGSAEADYFVRHFYRKGRRCVETKSSGFISKCVRYVEHYIPCRTKKVIFTLIPKLIDVKKGQVVYSRKIVKKSKASYCYDHHSYREPKTMQELLLEAKNKAIRELIRDISPYRVTLYVEFEQDPMGIKEKEIFNRALELAKEGKTLQACELFNSITSYTYAVLYNRGVCAELKGDLRRARDLYLKARAVSKSFRVEQALSRVNTRIYREKKLKGSVK